MTDDGVGFNVQTAKGNGGFGLIGMEERVRLVNGKLSIVLTLVTVAELLWKSRVSKYETNSCPVGGRSSINTRGTASFSRPNVESVGTVMDGRALVEEALRLKPDLIILDITMPLLNGIDAAVQIKKSLPG